MERCVIGGRFQCSTERLVEGKKGVVIYHPARLHYSFNNTHMFPDGHPIEVLEGIYDSIGRATFTDSFRFCVVHAKGAWLSKLTERNMK